jgi:excisionase family DNA binding protein
MKRKYSAVDDLPMYLTVEDVGYLLGISRAGAYTLAHSEGFPLIRVGKRMVVPRDALLIWLENQYRA